MTQQGSLRRKKRAGLFSGLFAADACRQRRLGLGLTQAELAQLAGYDERVLRRFELGEVQTRGSTREAILGALEHCEAVRAAWRSKDTPMPATRRLRGAA